MAQPANETTKQTLKQFESLIKYFQKKELKQKEAVCFDKRLRYFRMDDFINIAQENKHEIPKILKQWEFEEPLDSENGIKSFVADLISRRVILKLERLPDDPKYKWPKKLLPSREQSTLSEQGFYSWTITPKTSRFYTFLLIAGVAGVCLFQIWPLSVKIAIFYISLILLYFLLGLITVRLVLFFLFRVFGVDLWIFPNLFADVAFFESFKPVVSARKCEDSTTGYVVRFVGLVLMAYMFYRVSQEPDMLTDYGDMGKQTFEDLYEWGVLRLDGKTDGNEFGAGYRRPGDDLRKHLEDLLREEKEEQQAKEEPQPEEYQENDVDASNPEVDESDSESPAKESKKDDSEKDASDDIPEKSASQNQDTKEKEAIQTEKPESTESTKNEAH